jgi:hypothetical protein
MVPDCVEILVRQHASSSGSHSSLTPIIEQSLFGHSAMDGQFLVHFPHQQAAEYRRHFASCEHCM